MSKASEALVDTEADSKNLLISDITGDGLESESGLNRMGADVSVVSVLYAFEKR